ncbi:ankyrin repeat domain-containing protein 40-like [Haliotis rufescens]|uniref:ankyrin repeat domain-containing protein 40-like n=1 Tax=Haliotis rufescens TaxID=6454 RepID=UPI001EB01029|nr:ankyrin repeat domain-containing protein 40-like [Haliotis rufescens]
MDPIKELGERLREAACIGDIDTIQNLIESQRIDINNANSMNGWTALHWGAKRNHVSVVKYLMDHGADHTIRTNEGQIAENLTNNQDIRLLLGASGDVPQSQSNLPITPSYLQNPPFPHSKSRSVDSNHTLMASTPVVTNHAGQGDNELVFKARLANSDDRDFIEVELDKNMLTYEALLNLLCAELGVERRLVHKIRKLPDTVVRKDKDVRRLVDFQALELVLTNKAVSASSRNYGYSGSPGIRSEQILY